MTLHFTPTHRVKINKQPGGYELLYERKYWIFWIVKYEIKVTLWGQGDCCMKGYYYINYNTNIKQFAGKLWCELNEKR